MKFQVEMLAFGNWGEIREVEVPDHLVINDTTEMLETVFYYGQNDFQPVQHPSVSMGDVIRMGNDRYLVCHMGFRQLTPVEYACYTRLAQRDRHISPLLHSYQPSAS
jgi:hypothetical protein